MSDAALVIAYRCAIDLRHLAAYAIQQSHEDHIQDINEASQALEGYARFLRDIEAKRLKREKHEH